MALVAELGDEIVAVARYDRPPDAEQAEVAFTVAGRPTGSRARDDHARAPRRGRARTHGIHRFTAETLPDNRKMLGVFRDAGFQVVREFADGVVHVTFPIDPTDASQAMQDEREQISEARSVAPAARAAFDRGHRRGPSSRGRSATRCSATCSRASSPARCTRSTRNATAVGSIRAYPTVLDIPDDGRPRRHHRSRRVGRRRGATVGGQGRPRPRRDQLAGFAEAAAARRRRAGARRARPAARHAPGRARTAWAS